ncbi:MAG: PQQ-dependent sugar dehydrogenase [Pirellulaceae bacterium]|nr:PQQ-dependent sugar dehydrogenase [Pirellulaceae bacterium]
MNRRLPVVVFGFAFVSLIAGSVGGKEADKAAPRPAWTTSKIFGSPDKPEPYRIAPAFARLRFQKPSSLEELPGLGRLLVTEMDGRIYTFTSRSDTAQADLAIDLRKALPADLTNGRLALFDAEPHPKFRENRQVFVTYVHPGQGGHTRLSRFTLSADSPPTIAADSEQVLLTWPSGGHNAGCLEFGLDGMLYVATGDGSGPNPPDGLTTGQDVSDLLGAILRIDVDHPAANQPYGVPADNPFVGTKSARPEIWAYGLRNPWKFGIDPQSGDIFAADNGWETWELIHKIVRGGNCGWPVMEGRAVLRGDVPVGPTPILLPVKDHPHTEANSVIGGPVVRGGKLPGLAGAFVYGDYITGTIWAIQPDREGSYAGSTLCDTDLRIVGFLEASGGELYVLDYDFTGQIYELLPSDVPDTSATFPRKLSQTGLFQSVENLLPAPGVVPYSVKVPRWEDGAAAQHWVAIPGQGKITLSTSPTESAAYPEGTVLVKHLTLPQGDIPLETQLLHFERGSWRPYSYLWDENGRDATLVSSLGASRTIKPSEPGSDLPERTWHVNATNECKLCHNAGPGFILGFTAQQLDLASPAVGQLASLSQQGAIVAASPLPASDPARLVDPSDKSASLDDRARSYLHANCAMCHHPGGNAIVSFFLRRDLPFEKLNTNKGTGIGTFGMREAKLIVPGDPYRSVLMYRMTKLGYARMPYIGSRVVDSAGVSLIEEWIRSLPGEAAEGNSAPATPGTPEAKALADLTPAGVSKLFATSEGSLALALRLHHGDVPESAVRTVSSAAKDLPSDRRGLLDTFLPEAERRQTLGPTVDPAPILRLSGDANRGKLIFFSDGARCRNCHELDDRTKSLGPTLVEILKKFPTAAELVPHVLQPSLKIDEPVAAYTALLADGRIISGLVAEQSETEVVFKTAEKQLVRIPRKEIEELRKSPVSLMPERILADLTPQEAADLVAYLRTLAR